MIACDNTIDAVAGSSVVEGCHHHIVFCRVLHVTAINSPAALARLLRLADWTS